MKMTSVAVVKEINMNGTFARIKKFLSAVRLHLKTFIATQNNFMTTDFQYRNIQKNPTKSIEKWKMYSKCWHNGSLPQEWIRLPSIPRKRTIPTKLIEWLLLHRQMHAVIKCISDNLLLFGLWVKISMFVHGSLSAPNDMLMICDKWLNAWDRWKNKWLLCRRLNKKNTINTEKSYAWFVSNGCAERRFHVLVVKL